MGISYTLLTPRGEVKAHGSACWSNYTERMTKAIELGLLKTDQVWRTRLELGKDSEYLVEVPDYKYRNLHDQVFDKLFGSWFGPGLVQYEHALRPRFKARTAIVYSCFVPYWVMIASASVYRMHSDMSSFIYHWEQLDKIQAHLKYKMHPWTQYFMVTNIANAGNGSKDFLTEEVDLASTTNHMPIDGNLGDIHVIQHLLGWNAHTLRYGKDWYDPLPTLYQQWWKDLKVKQVGRDAHFCGYRTQQCNWLRKCGTDHSIVSTAQHRYGCKAKMHLPEFFRKVIIPNTM